MAASRADVDIGPAPATRSPRARPALSPSPRSPTAPECITPRQRPRQPARPRLYARGFCPQATIRAEQTSATTLLAAVGLGPAVAPANIIPPHFDGVPLRPAPTT
ncbi:hypothetical protein GA0115260_106329 [Streptomyces sp. MnatMP-M27]|nr:hypothetical protein GA0115260_106329 [Streptomyces sp. MnatMP-M27]